MTVRVYTATLTDGSTETVLRCERHAIKVGDLWMDPDAEVLTVQVVEPLTRPGAELTCYPCDVHRRVAVARERLGDAERWTDVPTGVPTERNTRP
jgi:hypothetical protein